VTTMIEADGGADDLAGRDMESFFGRVNNGFKHTGKSKYIKMYIYSDLRIY
jgi:hypothetical protein